MSDALEKDARREAAAIVRRDKNRGNSMTLRPFNPQSFVRGALWACAWFKAQQLIAAQQECDWDLAKHTGVIMPPTKQGE